MKEIDEVKKEMIDFRNAFGSCILASIDEKGTPISSYAPVIRKDEDFYIYISQVADHYNSIKNNPDLLEVMFLEDESKAYSLLLRKRLRYKAKAVILERDDPESLMIIKMLDEQMHGKGGIKNTKRMLDFQVVKLKFTKGRFVKGFGAAYDVSESGDLTFAGAAGSPHIIEKSKS